MRYAIEFALILIMALSGPAAALAQDASAQEATSRVYDRVQLTSLEWPPYTGEMLAGGGTSTIKLRHILRQAGLDLQVTWLPWQRAVREGLSDQDKSGYFPEYRGPDLQCDLSMAYDSSRVGFAWNRKASVFDWQTIADLLDVEIGIVDGYVNDGGPFDAAVNDGRLMIQKTQDDLRNMRKLAHGRLDAIVIDDRVMAWILREKLPGARQKIVMHEKMLQHHGLHVCAVRSAAGDRVRSAMASVLQGVDGLRPKTR